MKKTLAVLLCIALPVAVVAADNGHKVRYDGGSVPNLKAGANLKLDFDADRIRFAKDKTEILVSPASSITEISYGQDVHRRIGAAIGIGIFTLGVGALMALAKSKKHFIGVTWNNAGKKGGLAFQANKNDYRGVLAGIEGISGKKAVNADTMNVKN